jgi:N-acyl-D-aspartate/D-glutamate deacylase
MARFLGRCSRDFRVVALEQALARIMRLRAERVRFRDHGLRRAGAFADVTVLDRDEIGGAYAARSRIGERDSVRLP